MSQAVIHPPLTKAYLAHRSQTASSLNAAQIEVQPVESPRQLREFIALPKQLYRNDPHWVAPLDLQIKQFLDRKRHPFYQHGEAQAFLAKQGNRTVGRILASDDPRYNQIHHTNLGCFGMLDSIDDQRTCRALVETAAGWLRERGRTELLGPIDYSTNYPCGLLVDGFDTSPMLMMNHNPVYYERLLENCGLEKAKDLYAWWFDRENNMDAAWIERVEKLSQRFRVTVRSLDMNSFEQEIARCKAIYHKSLENNWGFVPMTDAEFDHMAVDLKRMAIPELVQLAEVDGQPVGLSIILPNLNEAIQPLNGRLTTAGFPLGLMRLLWRWRKIQSGRLAVLGVVPGYRCRGVAEALILNAFRKGMGKLDFSGAELSWTLEDNTLVNRMIQRVGGRRYKTYRLYRKSLEAAETPAWRPPRYEILAG